MPKRNSIFYRMTRENEDATSELLVNLMQEKYLRDIVMRWFLESVQGLKNNENPNLKKYKDTRTILDEIGASHIKTQKSYSELGRPDIVIESPSNYFVIENKIHTWTDLQGNQIDNYKKLLQEKSKERNALFFLIPKEYGHEKEIKDLQEKEANLVIVINYWNDLLEYLYAQGISKTSPVVNEALKYLKDTIDTTRNSTVYETTLTPYEVAMLYSLKDIVAVYALSEKIIELSNKFIECLKNELKNKEIKLQGSEQKNKAGIGRYFTIDASLYFIGLSPFLSNDTDGEKFVFSIGVLVKSIDSDIKESGEYAWHAASEKDGWYWVYLPLDKKCLFGDSSEIQQKEFNREASAVLEKLMKLDEKFNS